MTAVLPLSRLAHTRLFSGRGGGGGSSEVRRAMENRLSTTCCGVRTQGARVKTVATVAIRFLLAFLAFGQPCSGLCAARLDHGNALAVDRRHQDRPSGSGDRTLLVESVKVQSRIR